MIEISVFLICDDGLWGHSPFALRGRAHTQRPHPQRAHVTSMTQVRAVAELQIYISHSLLREGERPQCKFEDTRREHNRIISTYKQRYPPRARPASRRVAGLL